jgi:hypothetical protein
VETWREDEHVVGQAINEPLQFVAHFHHSLDRTTAAAV